MKGSFKIEKADDAGQKHTELVLLSGLCTEAVMKVDVTAISEKGHRLTLKCSKGGSVDIWPDDSGVVAGNGDFIVGVDSNLSATGNWELELA